MNKLKAFIKFLVKQTSTIIILFIGIILGIFILNLISPRVQEKTAESTEAHSEHKSETWTCSMHPQIRQPKFGKCPICFMDLIIAKDNGDSNSITLSKTSAKVAEVEVYPVERKFVEKKINLVGKVDYDPSAEECVCVVLYFRQLICREEQFGVVFELEAVAEFFLCFYEVSACEHLEDSGSSKCRVWKIRIDICQLAEERSFREAVVFKLLEALAAYVLFS